VSTNITHDSTGVFRQMLVDAIKVNPDARPVVISLIETLMDNDVPQASWGPIFFRLWQQLNNEPSQGAEAQRPVNEVAQGPTIPATTEPWMKSMHLRPLTALRVPHDSPGVRRWA
jgi:hypothetical protein